MDTEIAERIQSAERIQGAERMTERESDDVMADTDGIDRGRFGGDLYEGKQALLEVTEATPSANMLHCCKQIFLQLQREMKSKGIDYFDFSDVRIDRSERSSRSK